MQFHCFLRCRILSRVVFVTLSSERCAERQNGQRYQPADPAWNCYVSIYDQCSVSNAGSLDLRASQSFEEHGFWFQYKRALVLLSTTSKRSEHCIIQSGASKNHGY